MYDIFENGIEITLNKPEDFLKVKETLTRIGIISQKSKTLTSTCLILQKKGKFFITHFKEMFLLDGKEADFSESDKARRNAIVQLLEKWELVKLVNPKKSESPIIPLGDIKVLPFAKKHEYTLVQKYTIGAKH